MELPERISAERLNELVEKLKNGSISIDEKQEIINGHLRLIWVFISKSFNRHNRMDLFQEAVSAMTELLEVAGERMYDNNLSGYLVTAGMFAVRKWISKSRIVNMPVRTIRHYLQKGLNPKKLLLKEVKQANIPIEYQAEIMKLPIFYQEAALQQAKELPIEEFEQYIRSLLWELLPIPKVKTALADDPAADQDLLDDPIREVIAYAVPTSKEKPLIELREMLRLATESNIEQAILLFREQGYTYQEIGPMVGYHYTRVGQIVREIEKRFDNLNR